MPRELLNRSPWIGPRSRLDRDQERACEGVSEPSRRPTAAVGAKHPLGRISDDWIGIGVAVSGALATVVMQLLNQYPAVVQPRGASPVRFPDRPAHG
jgi:hypothetical protein